MSQLNKEYIQEVLGREGDVGMHAVGRALIHLFNRQTHDEQVNERTWHNNGKGFTGTDGEIGASMAKFYNSRGYLTIKQIAYWQKPCRRKAGVTQTTRIGKYWKQLLDEAAHKAGLKNCQETVPLKRDKEADKWCKKKFGKDQFGLDWYYNNETGEYLFADPKMKLEFSLTVI